MVHKEIDLDPIDYDNFHEKKQYDHYVNDDQEFSSNSHDDKSFQKEMETPPPEIDTAF